MLFLLYFFLPFFLRCHSLPPCLSMLLVLSRHTSRPFFTCHMSPVLFLHVTFLFSCHMLLTFLLMPLSCLLVLLTFLHMPLSCSHASTFLLMPVVLFFMLFTFLLIPLVLPIYASYLSTHPGYTECLVMLLTFLLMPVVLFSHICPFLQCIFSFPLKHFAPFL